MTGYCKNCRYSERATDGGGTTFYYCRALPPRPLLLGDRLEWTQPPMLPEGWCGLFKLAFWKWLGGLVSNGPRA